MTEKNSIPYLPTQKIRKAGQDICTCMQENFSPVNPNYKIMKTHKRFVQYLKYEKYDQIFSAK